MPRGRLLEYCVDPQHLAPHRTTTSSSRTKFKVLLLLGPPMYIYFSFHLEESFKLSSDMYAIHYT